MTHPFTKEETMTKLTNKQQAFIDEYLIDLNATQAAIRAGYSKDTAKQMGSENLSKPDIQDAIAERMNERREANAVTRESISKEIDTLIATAKTNAQIGYTAALTPWVKALETKAKLYGLFDEATRNDHNRTDDEPDTIRVDIIDARKPIYDCITGEKITED